MNTQDLVKEQEIDIFDYALGLVEQWRGMLAIGLAFAVLLSGIKYVRDYSQYKVQYSQMLSSGTVVDHNNSAVSLEPDKENSINGALIAYIKYQMALSYSENSILMRYSSGELSNYFFTYEISVNDPDSSVADFQNQYGSIDKSEFYDVIRDVIGEPENSYLGELIAINKDGSANIIVSMILPDDVDVDALEDGISSVIEKYSVGIQNSFGRHSVKLVFKYQKSVDNDWLVGKQLDKYNEMVNNRKNYLSAYKALDDATAQKELERLIASEDLQALLRERMIGEDEEQVETEEVIEVVANNPGVTLQKPVISKKIALIGLLGGVLLYVCCYLVAAILSRRMRRGTELQECLGLRSFGAVYEYPYKSLLSRFIHDKHVYKFRHRKECSSVQDTIKKINNGIDSRVKYEKLEDVSFIELGKITDWSKTVVDSGKTSLSDKTKLSLIELSTPSHDLKDEMLLSIKPVVMYISSGTRLSEIAYLFTRLHDYKIPILGTVFMEGPRNAAVPSENAK